MTRFTTPPLVAWFFFSILVWWITGTTPTLPLSAKDWAGTIPAILISILYYVSGLRNLSNKHWFDKVNENIRTGMLRIAEIDDDRDMLRWEKLRPIFYTIIDSDASLKIKSQQAHFNGWLWTTAADIRVFSLFFALLSFGLMWGSVFGALQATATFTIVFALTFFASNSITDKHKDIGNQQLEIIETEHISKLKNKLSDLNNGGR